MFRRFRMAAKIVNGTSKFEVPKSRSCCSVKIADFRRCKFVWAADCRHFWGVFIAALGRKTSGQHPQEVSAVLGDLNRPEMAENSESMKSGSVR
jgi:hypothetical protein